MFLSNVLLALAWLALTGQFTPINFLMGFVLAYISLWLMPHSKKTSSYFGKVLRVLGFFFYFFWQLIGTSLRVAYFVLAPVSVLRPGVIDVPMDAETDLEVTLLANLITLTPGSLSLDVSADRRVLYVYAMHFTDEEAFRRQIKEGLERRLLEVLR